MPLLSLLLTRAKNAMLMGPVIYFTSIAGVMVC